MTSAAEFLPIALEAARRAADRIRTQDPGHLTLKGDRDMATEVDYAVENELREFLGKETPDIGFLGEENGGVSATHATAWVLDPVDGTANFIHGLPLYAVSLALVEDGIPILGAVFLPRLEWRYWAAQGSGAWCDDHRLTASTTTRAADAIVSLGDYAVGHQAEQKNQRRFAVTQQLAQRAQRIRMLGSAAIDLCWVASGKLDACVLLSNKPWDTAAGAIIAREAGALVIDIHGQPHTMAANSVLATGPALANELLEIVSSS